MNPILSSLAHRAKDFATTALEEGKRQVQNCVPMLLVQNSEVPPEISQASHKLICFAPLEARYLCH